MCCWGRPWTILVSAISAVLSVYNIYMCFTVQLPILGRNGTNAPLYSEPYGNGFIVYSKPEEIYNPHRMIAFFSHEQFGIVMKELYKNHRAAAIALTWIFSIRELINAVLSAYCLLGGLSEGPARRILPWVYFNWFCLALSVLGSVFATVYVKAKVGEQAAIAALYMPFLWYFTWLSWVWSVYYYAKELLEMEREVAYDDPAGAVPFDPTAVQQWVESAGGRSRARAGSAGRVPSVSVSAPTPTPTPTPKPSSNVRGV